MNKIGIENLKNAAKEIIEIGMTVAKATEDGKINFAEGVAIAWEAKDLVGVAKKWDEIKQEYRDLDSDEMEELKDYVENELDIANDKVEVVIEKSFGLLVAINELVIAIKND